MPANKIPNLEGKPGHDEKSDSDKESSLPERTWFIKIQRKATVLNHTPLPSALSFMQANGAHRYTALNNNVTICISMEAFLRRASETPYYGIGTVTDDLPMEIQILHVQTIAEPFMFFFVPIMMVNLEDFSEKEVVHVEQPELHGSLVVLPDYYNQFHNFFRGLARQKLQGRDEPKPTQHKVDELAKELIQKARYGWSIIESDAVNDELRAVILYKFNKRQDKLAQYMLECSKFLYNAYKAHKLS